MPLKKFFTWNNLFLFLILIFAGGLYFYRLSSIPAGLYSDEAVVGYNAYSILKTGRDEYGQPFPVLFRFFGSYTPGLFVYFLVPFVRIFGLSVLTLRGVNALLMIISGLLLRQILKKHFLKNNTVLNLSLLLFYLTPWTLFNARLGYEVTFGFALFVLAMFFLFQKRLTPAFILLSLSTYAAHPYRFLSPVLIFFYLLFFRSRIKTLIKPVLLCLLLQIPHFVLIFTPAFWVKGTHLTFNFLSQYLSFFSPSHLFFQADPDIQRSLPALSLFHYWQILPLIFGLMVFKKHAKSYSYRLLLLIWLLTPLPAALSIDFFATQRALAYLLPLTIIMSLGLESFLTHKFLKLSLFVFIPFSLLLIWRSYFVLLPAERAGTWHAGYQQVMAYVKSHPDQNYLLENSRQITYIQALFWSRYDPALFQSQRGRLAHYYSDTTFNNTYSFGNIQTRAIIWPTDVYQNLVLVADTTSISDSQVREHCLTRLFTVPDPTGQSLLTAYATHPDLKRNKCRVK